MWVVQVIAAAAELIAAVTNVVNDSENRKLDWKLFQEQKEINKEEWENSKDNLVLQNDLAKQTATYNYELGIYLDRITTQSTINGFLADPNISKDCVTQYEETGYAPSICSSIGLDENKLTQAVKYKNEKEAADKTNKMKALFLAGLIITAFVAVVFYKDEVKKIAKNVSLS